MLFAACRQVQVRPVVLKGKHHLQFTYFTQTQAITKNAPVGSSDAEAKLKELLINPARLSTSPSVLVSQPQNAGGGGGEGGGGGAELQARSGTAGASQPEVFEAPQKVRNLRPMPFVLAVLKTRTLDTSIRIKPISLRVTITHSSHAPVTPQLMHDREKQMPIPVSQSHAFLVKLGLQTPHGRVKDGMGDKMTQVRSAGGEAEVGRGGLQECGAVVHAGWWRGAAVDSFHWWCGSHASACI